PEGEDRVARRGEGAARGPGAGNAALFAGMVRVCESPQRRAFADLPLDFVEEKTPTPPAGPAYRGSYAWALAGLGETRRARSELATAMAFPHAFDANWLSLQAECAEATVLLDDPTHAALLYERLAP